ncbi:hypothetical protein BOVATA_026830 [Babesia ovata]|uniref:Uncharacterized protein n=1 Tax=Babesia ovata TaxID=189622 RepID=A0A2H6KDW2_9APIC|nr:uncharacterized protein BOVATA_026830 [Babesia ovata]GBE61190.1 hypothetical protein BOVATA_026830 [Babesia ovata]
MLIVEALPRFGRKELLVADNCAYAFDQDHDTLIVGFCEHLSEFYQRLPFSSWDPFQREVDQVGDVDSAEPQVREHGSARAFPFGRELRHERIRPDLAIRDV